MKIKVASLVVIALLASISGFSAAPPTSKPSVVRVHSTVSITAHGLSISDTDFVVTRRSTFGYTNTSPNPGGGRVVTTFYRGVPSNRALTTLQEQISSLQASEIPSTCGLESGSFTIGSYEITLYNGDLGSARVITVALDHNAPANAQCPANVAALMQLLNNFFRLNARPIP